MIDQDELMKMAEAHALCTSAGYVELSIQDLTAFACAILERAAVEVEAYAQRHEESCKNQDNPIRRAMDDVGLYGIRTSADKVRALKPEQES